jgi:Cu/Ag efflux protein CusF
MHIRLTPNGFKEFRKKFNTLANKARTGDFISFNFEQSEDQLIIEIANKKEAKVG